MAVINAVKNTLLVVVQSSLNEFSLAHDAPGESVDYDGRQRETERDESPVDATRPQGGLRHLTVGTKGARYLGPGRAC